MAYNRVNTGSISGKGRYVFSPGKLSGGLSRFDNGNNSSLTQLSNMLFENGALVQRGAFCEVCAPMSGKFHSILDREFEGNVFMHIGTSVMRFDGKELIAVKEQISDCESVFLAMNGNVYLYTAEYEIYEIKKDMSCEKVEPYIPEVVYSRDIRLEDYDVLEPVNLLTKKVKCSYKPLTNHATYTLPYEVDPNVKVDIYFDGVLTTDAYMMYAGPKALSMRGSESATSAETVSLVYSISDNEEAVKDNLAKVYGSTVSFCYGGTVNDGTRAFLTGNDSYPGSYFRSELKQPLYFPDTNEEIVGDGCEKITAAQKRYEKLFFFTEKHIYSMQYEFSMEDGASFPVTEVYSPVGCDMKNVVRSIDNTPVFADRNSGIYLLQSTDIFDELNVKHISANLKGEWSIGKDSEKSFAACDFDRKYYIYDGSSLFVWDYGATPYYSGSDYDKAESRLSWYRLDGLSDCVYIFGFEGKLYFVTDDGSFHLVEYFPDAVCDTHFSDGKEESADISSSFMTKGYDLDGKITQKRLVYLSFDCAVYEKSGEFSVEFYGDGKRFYSYSPAIPENDRRLKIKLPPYYADKFAVKFVFKNAKLGISGLSFCYVPIQREKYNL